MVFNQEMMTVVPYLTNRKKRKRNRGENNANEHIGKIDLLEGQEVKIESPGSPSTVHTVPSARGHLLLGEGAQGSCSRQRLAVANLQEEPLREELMGKDWRSQDKTDASFALQFSSYKYRTFRTVKERTQQCLYGLPE